MVSGEIVDEGGTISSWLKDNNSYITYSSPVDNGGKYAVTHFHVLNRTTTHSLVEYKLETGRKNQIRMHTADISHLSSGGDPVRFNRESSAPGSKNPDLTIDGKLWEVKRIETSSLEFGRAHV